MYLITDHSPRITQSTHTTRTAVGLTVLPVALLAAAAYGPIALQAIASALRIALSALA